MNVTGLLQKLATDYPLRVLALITAASILAATQIPALKIDISAQGMMVKNDSEVQFFLAQTEQFGAEKITLVVFQDPKLFSPEKLALIKGFQDRIAASRLVARTESLFSMSYLRTVDEFLYTSPYLDPLPTSQEQANAIRIAALRNPFVRKQLLSEDGQMIAINVYLDAAKFSPGDERRFSEFLDREIATVADRFEHAFHLGDPLIRSQLSDLIVHDQGTLVPLAVFVLLLILGIGFRHLGVAILPLLTAGLSILWTFAMMAALDISVSVITSIIPALLIIIGSTEDIHLLTEYRNQRQKNRLLAIRAMNGNLSTIISLTFATTFLGFLSIAANPLELLQEFGVISASGLLFNFLITVTLVPAALRLFPMQGLVRKRRAEALPTYLRHMETGLGYLYQNRGLTLFLFVAVSLMFAYGAMRVQINNNVMDYFAPDSDIRRKADLIQEQLAGTQTLSVILEGQKDQFLAPQVLQQVDRFAKELTRIEGFDRVLSLADLVGVVHAGVDSEIPADPYLPDHADAVAYYFGLLGDDKVKSFVSSDYGTTRIIVRHHIESSEQLTRLAQHVENSAEEWLEPGIRVRVTGESYLNGRAIDYMSDGQIHSLALMLSVTILLMSILYHNLKAGLIALLTNLFPIILLFGVMGYFSIPMDSGSVMVAAISLGICVDHSIHFMGRYIQNSRTFAGQKRALQETLQHSTLPIVATALALTGGFLVLAFSSFPPVARFGLLSALVMLLALVSTFVILPLLLKYTRFIDLWDAIDVHLDRSRVLDCPLFADIPHRGVRRLIKLAKLGVIAPHKPIVTQGQSVDRIYVILEGSADAWHTQADGSIVRKARLLPGELFGELPMITNGQCLADIICQERTVVLTLRTSVLRQFSQIYPKWAAQLHMNLLTIVGAEIGRLQRSGQSVLDQLTGTFNQASFEQLVSSFVAQAERHNESLIMLSVRITNAPALIEQSSRSAYMDFLQGVAKAIQTHTRQADFCSRRGLDEFHVLLPKTDREGAESVIRKIRDNLPDRGFGPIWADIAFSPQQLTRETSGRTMDPPTEPLGGLPPAALMAK